MKTADIKNSISLINVQGIIPLTFLIAAESALLVGVPFLSGRFINTLVYGGGILSAFLLLCAGSALAVLLVYLRKRMAAKISRREELCLQERMLEKLLTIKPGQIDEYKNGEAAIKFFRDASGAGTLLREFYPQCVCALLGLVFALTAAFCQNLLIAGVFAAFFPVMSFTSMPFRKVFSRINHAVRLMYDRSVNRFFEFIHIYPALKSIAAEAPFTREPRSRFHFSRRMNDTCDKAAIHFEVANRMVLFFGEYLLLCVAGFLAWKKVIRVGDVVFFQTLFLSMLNACANLFQLLPMLEGTKESIRSIHELLDNPLTEDCETGLLFPSGGFELEAKGISFAYPHSKKTILSDFSCRIRRGRIVAITGENGTGKTTLLKLLIGCLEPKTGEILAKGKKMSVWSRASYRSRIATVFQDSMLMTGSIRDNITLKNKNYTELEMKNALHLSGADSLIARIPDGLEHRIGIDGGGLSGGERQKVAIARALIRKPDLLIFDEVTNHLDYESRWQIKKLISTLRGETTLLLVSHDPEIIELCDEKIDLRKGFENDSL